MQTGDRQFVVGSGKEEIILRLLRQLNVDTLPRRMLYTINFEHSWSSFSHLHCNRHDFRRGREEISYHSRSR